MGFVTNMIVPNTIRIIDYSVLKFVFIIIIQVKWNLSENVPSLCLNQICNDIGHQMKQNLDPTVDPCEDFYEFACGGWINNNTIPSDESDITQSFYVTRKLLESRMNIILNETADESDSEAVKYALNWYKSCNDYDNLESRGTEPLKDLIRSSGHWPMMDENYFSQYNYSFDSDDRKWLQILENVIGNFGVNTIISVSVGPDANDTQNYIIYLDQPEFGIGINQLINITDNRTIQILNAYKTLIYDVIIELNPNLDSGKLMASIDKLINLEAKLAEISTEPEFLRNPSVWYNKMSISDLQRIAPQINWIQFLNQIFYISNTGIELTPETELIVRDMKYIISLGNLLTDGTFENEVIHNYIIWSLVQNYLFLTNNRMRQIEFEFLRVLLGTESMTSLSQQCLNFVLSALPYALSRKYIDKYFDESDNKIVLEILNDIHSSYEKLMVSNDWMDEGTREKAINKLRQIKRNVAFPLWLINNQDLDNYYNINRTVNEKEPFEEALYLVSTLTHDSFINLNRSVNWSLSWTMTPIDINAAYDATQNSITFPASILQIPFFNSHLPINLNFGAIGVIMGHELTHGFDDEGRRFDANGNLIEWWSNETRYAFEQKADCFVKQYSRNDLTTNFTLNGRTTLGENIADNGGINEAYNAFVEHQKRHNCTDMNECFQSLPDMQQYSASQMFFLSYANLWCSKIRDEALPLWIQYDPHSLPKLRVNIVAGNSVHFSEAFNCPNGAPMNPIDKCSLW